jgi:D-3-phosphoglycerate dehydrogenase
MTLKHKVLLYESIHSQGTRLLEQKCSIIYPDNLDEDTIIRLAGDVDALIIRANGTVTKNIIESAPRLKVIGRHGVGLDAIDLLAARQRGVKVVYTPWANTESVAEHFVALALNLAKKIRLADNALRTGNWNARYELIGSELFGKTLGVLGFGKIGQQTARICHSGFKMQVVYSDQLSYPQIDAELDARHLDIEDLVAESDFVSVNLPLVPGTRHLINSDLFKLMKPTAYIINMARGPVWKENDLLETLIARQIAGAASDVYEVEPAPPDNPLFKLDNFLGTPHMSAHTEESMVKMSRVAEDVLAVMEGREPKYPAPYLEK